MRRIPSLALAAWLAVPAPVQAQKVGFAVRDTAEASGLRIPLLLTPGILRDNRWRESLQNSFPLRIQFRVELWRVRTDWFDALERGFEFEVLVEFEPLTDEYAVTRFWLGAARHLERFTSLAELERSLEKGYQVTRFGPTAPGEYYFTAGVRLRTLSDDDMDELERFLRGNPDTPRRERGNPVTRAARRFLMNLGGLPSDELEARSARFTIDRPRD